MTMVGGWDVPSAGSSFHVMFVTNRKGHSPRRLPPAAHPLGLQWVAASVTFQLCWVTSQSKPGVSAASQLVQRDYGSLERLK